MRPTFSAGVQSTGSSGEPPSSTAAVVSAASDGANPTDATSAHAAPTVDKRLLGVHWLLLSVRTASSKAPTATARFPQAAVEFTATYLAYDLYCSGALHTYTATAGQFTPGPALDTIAHGCGPEESGPGPDAITALAQSATPVQYTVTARTLTMTTATATLVFGNNGRAVLYEYWPQLYPNSDLAAWVSEPATPLFPVSYRRPQQWQLYPFHKTFPDLRIAGYLSTDPLHNPCTPGHIRSTQDHCGPPIHQLAGDGVLITLGGPIDVHDGSAADSVDTANTTVAGWPAHLTDRRATGDCTAIGGNREIVVHTTSDPTVSHPLIQISACIKGPYPDQVDHTFRQLVKTITYHRH
ncbi:hypothetical protein GCM10011594_41640 [Nakamurella endophytica]|uniref:Uncharacterized protein n=1 Tax=Nakamurella endophytica TaxID=1748367 RepID=A0A917TE43_9ACTN|nr:hypothetical protein GCM10011594_41640 [Nakamurella endophytica]